MKDPSLDSTDLTWLAGLARAMLGEPHGADDLVQETTVAALESTLPQGAPKRAWLASVARRLAARRFRSDARRKSREQVAARSEALPDSAELVEKAEIAEQVTAATRRLPEPYRRTILLRFLEGMTPEEIARKEGKPADTVRWRVRQGLELLREELVRKHDRNWSSWCVLLTPLAHSRVDVGLATAGATGTSSGTVVSLMMIKLKIAVVVAVGCLGTWLAWESRTQENTDALVADVSTPTEIATATADLEPAVEPVASTPKRAAVNDSPVEQVPVEVTTDELLGSVVDEEGKPIAGALVFLIQSAETAPGKRARDRVRTQAESNGQGEFRIAREDWSLEDAGKESTLELGVTANGFLRQSVKDVLRSGTSEPRVVVLERGRTLKGRVIDEYGLPVANLELIAFSAYSGVDHVSPSQRQLRAERNQLTDSSSTYDQCRATTDGRGEVVFSGLPDGELQVLPLQAGWTIEEQNIIRENDLYIEWVVQQRLGVKLTVIDIRTGQPIDKAAATFRFELTFADGETRDFGQWVGRGSGEVSFVLGAEALPGLEERTITGAAFYGTVRASEGEPVDWKAEALEDPNGVVGVAEVRIELDSWAGREAALTTAADELKASGTTTLIIDVRYEDSVPFEGELTVDWISKTNSKLNDDVRAEAVGLGRYRVEIPAGQWTLEVADRFASGSLPAWADEVRCLPDQTKDLFATLPRGSSASIVRPEGWTGEWFVHASWRKPGTEEWRGSLGYSTDESRLTLDVLRPAEWKFELRRNSALESPTFVRTALLVKGESTTLDD